MDDCEEMILWTLPLLHWWKEFRETEVNFAKSANFPGWNLSEWHEICGENFY